ncbi:GNAT family N-acetyltransferase [Archangium sp.]|uniref:GNAT family N-acetyltransferase n=1 Tax=Archangium sp. TaxID=1872627 RepID=UPI002D4DA87D|nr:GNAT family N-acetyltransferase [Archangium sp.]HYO56009.1 GNAT family N-acetyltransferase [Archangium sp.]
MGHDNDVLLREFTPSDAPALEALFRACPDTGRVRATVEHQIDTYRALQAMRPRTMGFVAMRAGSESLMGALLTSISTRHSGGRLRSCALLHSLMVHPEHRLHGLAHKLLKRTVELARATVGDEGVIVSNVQEGNAGSITAIGRALPHRTGQYEAVVQPMRRRPPARTSGVQVREARPEELGAIAEQLETFYENHELYPPQTGSSLAAWLGAAPPEAPLRRYYVATDTAGRLRAGLAVVDPSALRIQRVHHIPPMMRLIDRFAHLLRPDGTLRQLSVDLAWFLPGAEEAARALWETVRWELRDQGSALGTFFDGRSPLRAMPSAPFFWPRARFITFTADAGVIRPERLLYPVL